MATHGVWRLLVVGAITLSGLVAGGSPAFADGTVSGLCVTWSGDIGHASTCFFGVEIGPRNNVMFEFMMRDDDVPNGTCTVMQTRVPGSTSFTTIATKCNSTWTNFSIAVPTFFGKIDARLCTSSLSQCTPPIQHGI